MPGEEEVSRRVLVTGWEGVNSPGLTLCERGVAQPGRALRSGRRGRGFKSRLPDSSFRDVAQPGSAPEWGSGGRGFESRRPDSPNLLTACLWGFQSLVPFRQWGNLADRYTIEEGAQLPFFSPDGPPAERGKT